MIVPLPKEVSGALLASFMLGAMSCAPAAQSVPKLLPDAVQIMAVDNGPALLRQCSRASPEGGEPFWQPEAAQIIDVENALIRFLAEHRGAHAQYIADERERYGVDAHIAFDFGRNPQGWMRQYIGYTQGGQRMIYGNFLPMHDEAQMRLGQPNVVCDGGPQFFGVEFDIRTQQVVRVAFNGGFGGPFIDALEN